MMCLLAALGVKAINYTGTNITLSEPSAGGPNKYQLVVTTEAGAFATFMQSSDAANFGNEGQRESMKICVFSGPMNRDDFNAMTWGSRFEVLNFTNVTMQDYNLYRDPQWPNDNTPRLIILPKDLEPTNTQLVNSIDPWQIVKPRYGYYLDGNTNSLCFTSATTVQKPSFKEVLKKLENMIKHDLLSIESLQFTYTPNNNGGWDYYYACYGNNNGDPEFIKDLGKLPLECIDFRGCNISSIGTDFTNLNPATHYILLPVGGQDSYTASKDITNTEVFSYPNSLKLVGTYISDTPPYGDNGSFGGKFINMKIAATAQGSMYGLTHGTEDEVSSVAMTFVLQAGGFDGAMEHLPAEMAAAKDLLVYGTINNSDLVALSGSDIVSSYIDLEETVLSDGSSIRNFSNKTAKYVALPLSTYKEDVDYVYNNITSQENNNLKCVASYNINAIEAAEGYQAVPARTLITYSSAQGSVFNTLLLLDEAHNTLTNPIAGNVNNVIMSGRLNAFDICQSIDRAGTKLATQQSGVDANAVSYTMALASDGHLYSIDKLPQGESLPVNGQGGTTLAQGALNGASNLDMIDFTNALFDQPATSLLTPSNCAYFTQDEKKNLITDMNFTALGLYANEVKLPTDPSQIVIPPFFLSKNSSHIINEICIPYNFQYIMDGAFNLCGSDLYHIYTTADPAERDLIETAVDNGVEYSLNGKVYKSTYTIGSAVRYIATAAFDTNDASNLSDVYVLARIAPSCEPNAFNSSTLIGNNGFQLSHPINRDCYINSVTPGDNTGANHWIAVLHFPNSLDNDAKKKYTDIDRVYLYPDETGAVDGEGNLLRWPAHTEFLRSYNQANYGYTWYEWDPYRTGLPGWGNFGEAIVVGPYSMTAPIEENITLQVAEWDGGTGCYVESKTQTTTKPYKANDCSQCGFANTIGWHQFLLSQPGYFYEHESTTYVETPWYTFCVPFDMTADELQEYLGVPQGVDDEHPDGAMPDVRTLIKVKREPAKNHTTLVISKNLVEQNKDVVTYGQSENLDDICQNAQYVSVTRTKDDVPVLLKGGYPYFVKGWVPQGTEMPANLGKYVLAQANFDDIDLGNVIIVNGTPTMPGNGGEAVDLSGNIIATKMYESTDDNFIAMPWLNHTINAVSVDENGVETQYGKRTTLPAGITEDKPMLYTFIGNYEQEDYNDYDIDNGVYNDKKLPLYTYYMGNGNIYRYTKLLSGYNWKPYICMIGRDADRSVLQIPVSEKMTYHSDFKNLLDDNKWGKKEFDSQDQSAGVGTFSFEFEEDIIDGEATKLTNLNGEDIIPVGKAIYNLNGQYMGTSIDKLNRGVYVIGGKKYVVK